MEGIINNIFEQYGIQAYSMVPLERNSVIYNQKIERSVFFVLSGNKKFVCKVFSNNHGDSSIDTNILFKEQLYLHFFESSLTISPLKNIYGNIVQNVDNTYYILFEYYKLSPIKKGDSIEICNRYISFRKKLIQLKAPYSGRNFKKEIFSTILKLYFLPSDFSQCIGKYISLKELKNQLLQYITKIDNFELIHGSLWKENIYKYNGDIFFIDFDNISYGDPYYDQASLAIMFYEQGSTPLDIIEVLRNTMPDFDHSKFLIALLFASVKIIRNLQPHEKNHTKNQLNISLNLYIQLCNI